MGNYSLKNISSIDNQDFSEGVFIILFNVTNTPPHLLLSINGKIYSITDSGRQIGSSLEKLQLFIQRKKVPTIFVEWKELESCNVGKLKSSIVASFAKYDRVIEGKVSCLFPIRDVATEILGEEMNHANFIFELLPLMEKKNAIGKSYAFNLEQKIEKEAFELMRYTEEDLKKALANSKGN